MYANVILRYLLGGDRELTGKAKAIFAALEAGAVTVECDPVN